MPFMAFESIQARCIELTHCHLTIWRFGEILQRPARNASHLIPMASKLLQRSKLTQFGGCTFAREPALLLQPEV